MKKLSKFDLKIEQLLVLKKKNLEKSWFLKIIKESLKQFPKIYNYGIAYNLIYFFSKYKVYNSNIYYKNIKLWKNKIFSLPTKNDNNFKKLLISNSLIKMLNFLLQLLYINNLNKLYLNKFFCSISSNKNLLTKSFIDKNSLNTEIKGFLYIRKTKNNFFVTISDYTGNTLVSRSGGNTGWVGTRQKSTVFSADSALYECCFLAKERGLQSVIVHIRSSLRFQQIKHCFDGLLASGLTVDSVVYRPIKAFGGCRPSKLWRV